VHKLIVLQPCQDLCRRLIDNGIVGRDWRTIRKMFGYLKTLSVMSPIRMKKNDNINNDNKLTS